MRSSRHRALACIAALATVVGASPAFAGPATAGLITVSCADATTDAATLQNAVNASSAGSTIEIQAGTCLLTSGITLLGDRTYIGGSTTGTVLKQDATLPYLFASDAYVQNQTTTGDPITVRDLTLDCSGSGSTDGLIVMSWHVDVEHVDVTGCGGTGILDTNTNSAGSAITNTSVNSRFESDFITGSGQYGFEVYDSGNAVTDGYLLDSQIASSALDGVHLQNAAGWNITGNHLYGDGQNAIHADRLYGTTIADNYIEDFDAAKTTGTYYGIDATSQAGIASTISGNKVFNFTGRVTGAGYRYIAVNRTNYATTGYLAVTGNTIYGDGSSDVGFYFAGAPNSLDIASTGNQVANVGTTRFLGTGATVTKGI